MSTDRVNTSQSKYTRPLPVVASSVEVGKGQRNASGDGGGGGSGGWPPPIGCPFLWPQVPFSGP